MKTAERILLVSLELFNQHGESSVSSVDISLELEISPGNLYYHFKGKEIIIEALFELYRNRMSKILLSPQLDELTIDEFFYYLFLIFETSHLYRFLFRNPADLLEKYPKISRRFKMLLSEKEKVFRNAIAKFVKQGTLIGNPEQQEKMIELISILITQAPNYHILKGDDINNGGYIQKSLATILFAMAPYLNIDEATFMGLHQSIAEDNKG